ncbi:hypothetical protein PHPALM_27924 [Phytophthora palmivora]|uniref:Uncharacterized protein n=1 Tax=Phytophthora palmivora TaxID=4796 RepID=A0A2P4XBD0_9STRA|nr:hypothetical protein PHPALM_27924 [Phytophthora palmivora]
MINDKKQGEEKLRGEKKKPGNCIVPDISDECYKTSMENWCASQGIKLMPYAPDGSSINYAERAVLTLRNPMKAMMSHSGLPPSFWPDALRNATYVRNRVLCKGTSRTPFELFFGRKPDIYHIKKHLERWYMHIYQSV